MGSLRTTAARLACAAGLTLAASGCVDVYRGAIVQFNLSQLSDSAEGQHYQLFAVLSGGVVPLAQFKVFDRVAGCGADPATTPPGQVVQRYDEGADRATLCAGARTLGAIDRIDLGSASLIGGVRVDTPVDLSGAERLFITLEADGDADPRPGQVIMGADLGAGVAPYDAVEAACVADFCASADPAGPAYAARCGDNAPQVPRARRGVLVGAFLSEPTPDDPCFAARQGDVAVVPADDDTFL